MNNYQPVKITLENMDIKIPELVHTLKIDKRHSKELNDLFLQKN